MFVIKDNDGWYRTRTGKHDEWHSSIERAYVFKGSKKAIENSWWFNKSFMKTVDVGIKEI